MATRRLTTGQALINYLAVQHVERDGNEARFFAGLWGIFGHGNIGGVAQAIQQAEADFPYYLTRNEQAMVHIAAAFAKHWPGSGHSAVVTLSAAAGTACDWAGRGISPVSDNASNHTSTALSGPGITNRLTGTAGPPQADRSAFRARCPTLG